ncbi:MAG: sigma-70 family RNA polymerase sigma factor [Prevotellaceae bacterium]|jgi:RNA polymerase sigma-70 factor (ECF subfamily)|nr:sigma-70 family RNA polymerase sigma factor [Prevotellaceae bacterium]
MLNKRKVEINESDCIRQFKEGSREAYTVLYKFYLPKLHDFIYNLTASKDAAQEIVQETFVKLWIKRKNIDPERPLKSYLYTIARNQMLNEFRRQINRPVFAEYIEYANQLQLSENTAETTLDLKEFIAALNKAKQKLSSRQLQIFRLNKELGQSVHDIAQQLNITEQSVRNQLSAAIGLLRKEMKNFVPLFVFLFL